MNTYKVTHKTSSGSIIVEEETSLKWVNIIISSVMRDGGEIVGITKETQRGIK